MNWSWEVDGKCLESRGLLRPSVVPRPGSEVYVRKLDVFPPQGTSIRDSFRLAAHVGPEYPGRRYWHQRLWSRYPVR
jgi:hypothetical protein